MQPPKKSWTSPTIKRFVVSEVTMNLNVGVVPDWAFILLFIPLELELSPIPIRIISYQFFFHLKLKENKDVSV